LSETNHGFEAYLFHPGLGNEVVAGRVLIDPRALIFQSEAATLNIPIGQLVVELGDDEGRIYFRDKKFPNLRIYTNDDSILQNRRFPFIREQLERSLTRKEIARRLRITAYVVAGCFFLGWLGVGVTGAMVRSLVTRVPPEWEQNFGELQMASFKSGGLLLDDSNRVAQLTRLTAPLLAVVPRGTEFKFHILAAGFPNAFALPGGHIVVTSGLLKLADNTELAGVIAHESAHLALRHHARKIISSAGPVLIFGIFLHSRDQWFNELSADSGLMVEQGFSQEYEFEADAAGWKYLAAANIDPRGMISMFRKFKAQADREKAAAALPQAFQSHPALDQRIARLEAEWKKLPRKSGFVELEAVDRRQP
jgi:Zn-dependent protease with chaperone function